MTGEQLLTFVLTWGGHFANVIAVVGIPWSAIQVHKNYKLSQAEKRHREAEEKRLNERIKIVLVEKNGKRRICFPASVRRAEFTRAEVQGRLSVGRDRYHLSSLNTKECLEMIDHLYVSSGEDNCRFEIPCDQSEIDTFPPERLRLLGFELSGFET